MRTLLSFILLVGLTGLVNAQNYHLVWEDNFNGNSLDSSKWNIEQKIGVWNTGSNHEFQHYKKENVSVGNDGEGHNCLIITAKKEEFDGYHYTSGRVNTKGKFAFKRGKLEASIRIPNLANGLWPAFWTLGYTPTGWPDCGETDILEMGQAEGITAGKQNSCIGSHLFWGPYPRDYGKTCITSEDLSDGFYTHTVLWDENKISVYFNGASTPYFSMGITGSDAEEFHNFQNYIIFNLAVGGSVPGIFDMNGITASLPARMLVDWVKVYQLSDDIGTNDLPIYGIFGIFEDNGGSDMKMDLGYDLIANLAGLTQRKGETPKEGSNVLSYNTESGKDYQLKLTSPIRRNMTNYKKGSVQFYLKTNISGDIQLGVSDTTGKESFITIGEKSSQNIARDGSWQSVYLPLSEVTDAVDISALKDMMILKGTSSSNGYISVDEVIYSETAPVKGVYGIYTNNPSITDKFTIDNVNGFLYNWSNTVAFNTNIPSYEGTDVLSLRSSGAANWWGFGIFSSQPLNLESYANGFLHLALRTKSTELFRVAVNGANDSKGEITFTNGSDPYGFIRDGKWHLVTIPVSELVKQGLKLSACGNIFTMSGGAIADIGADDVYLSMDEKPLKNSALCYPVALSVTPKNPTVKAGAKKKFSASATNQFGKAIDASVTWESRGGTIQQDGNFVAAEPGTYTVIARMDNLADSTSITVQSSNGIEQLLSKITLTYQKSEQTVQVKGLEKGSEVQLYNLSGTRLLSKISDENEMNIYLGKNPNRVYLLRIRNNEKAGVIKFLTN